MFKYSNIQELQISVACLTVRNEPIFRKAETKLDHREIGQVGHYPILDDAEKDKCTETLEFRCA